MSDTLDQLLAAAVEPWLDAHTRRGAVVEAMRAELAAAGYVIVKRDAPPDTLAAALGMEHAGAVHTDSNGDEMWMPLYKLPCARCEPLYRFVRPSDTRTEPEQ